MSIKTTIFTVLAVLGSVLGVFSSALGLTIDPAKVLAGVAAILVYVFGALKTDLAGLAQPLVWKDPKVWLSAVAAGLAAVTAAGVVLPISPELIMAVLTAIVAALFKPAEVTRALRAKRASVQFKKV